MKYGIKYKIFSMIPKRILFDSSTADITRQNGGGLAVLAYLNSILELYPGRVDVITPAELNIKDERFNNIDVVKRSEKSRNVGFLQGKFYRSADFIVHLIKKNPTKYDWIFLNGGLQVGYVVEKLRKLNIKIAVFHHNFEPEYQIGSKSIISLYGRTAFWVKKWERKAYKHAYVNFFITHEDKSLFENEYGKRINNYVLGVYEPKTVYGEKPIEHFEKSVAITGSLCDMQNLLSLRRFKKNYLQAFHETLPDWQLNIMGRNPSQEILEWEDEYPFVKVFPSPENIRELCSQSPIYLCQMDDGGGLKLRIMDGLRNGQPVLTHRVSARGYNAFENESFFKVYDDEVSFINGLKEISAYSESADFSREYIQAKYYEEFGFDSGTDRLKKILSTIIKE